MTRVYTAPDTLPHEPPPSRCRRECCWTPHGHSAVAPADCTCHEGTPMADRTPPATLRTIDRRDAADGTRRCVLTGTAGDRIVPQHRQGGMGGRPDKHRPANVLWADSLLNGLIESDAEWQAIAKAWGAKVPIWVRDVTLVPVFYRFEHAWFLLEGDARRQITAVDALDRMLEAYGDDYLAWKAIADDSERSRALLNRAVL